MRVFYLPDTMELLAILGFLLVVGIGVAAYQWLRPPAAKKLFEDDRYRQGLSIFSGNLPAEREATDEERKNALAGAVDFLAREHGIPAEEASRNLWVLIGEYDREQSYELRQEGITYEQAGAHELALDCYERAARLRKEHDREDYEFLLRCIARVRGKARPR